MLKEKLLTSTEAGEVLGVSRPTIHAMVERGELKPAHVTDSGWTYYDPADVQRLARLREQGKERADGDRRRAFAEYEARSLVSALNDYRALDQAKLDTAIVEPHVALAAVRLATALGLELEMSSPGSWGQLAAMARLDRGDAELLVSIGESIVNRAATAA